VASVDEPAWAIPARHRARMALPVALLGRGSRGSARESARALLRTRPG
jgi:hypothetical protein